MKRYVSSGVSVEQLYVVIVKLNNQPIGYLSNKKELSGIVVQLDPNDLTKAHGVVIGSARSIKSKLRHYPFDSATELDVMNGKDYIKCVLDKDFPFYVSRGRMGSSNWKFGPKFSLTDLSNISYEIVPAEHNVYFVDIASACHMYPSVSKTIPDFYTWDFIAGPSNMWEYLFKNHSYDEINQGVDNLIVEFPFLISKLIAWGEKHRDYYEGDIEVLNQTLDFLTTLQSDSQFDYRASLHDICEKYILDFVKGKEITDWTDKMIEWFHNIISYVLSPEILEKEHMSHDVTTKKEVEAELNKVFQELLSSGRI